MNIKKWEVRSVDKDKAVSLADTYSLPAILAMLLQLRGITDREKINELFGEGAPLDDPFMLKDMDRAVDRIVMALENMEKIAVYGDYDADGITATSIVYTYLKSKNANIMYYIPNREGEGYGMNIGAVEYLKEQGVNLIITVDNGIASVQEVARANELGMDVVITDHHRPHPILPDAVAVIDPYRADCPSEFKDFAGAGIAYKLIMALETDLGDDPDSLSEIYSDLATLGTIGDIVPLLSENRTLVKYGLNMLVNSERPGIKALLEKSGTGQRELSSTTVAFTLVPRINATGRMGAPDRAVRLLTCDDEAEAYALAEEICEDNTRRRSVESTITESVINVIENNEKIKYSRVIVVEGENWHHGVVGIVAARITDRYGKPCMIISYSGNEAKGSGRSVGGFSLFDAISYCEDTLIKFGGHPMAAGITLERDRIDAFRDKINDYAKLSSDIMPYINVNIDCKLLPSALSTSIPESLVPLEPFGAENPAPVFGLFGMKLENIYPVGGGNHLKLNFTRNGAAVSCMKFSMTAEEFPFSVGSVLDLAVSLESKIFRGNKNLTVLVKEMKLSEIDMDSLCYTYRLYEKFKVSEELTQREYELLYPTRDDMAEIYRFLRSNNGFDKGITELLFKFKDMNIGKLKLSLDILYERKLITLEKNGDLVKINLCAVKEKVDIFDSTIVHKLNELVIKK